MFGRHVSGSSGNAVHHHPHDPSDVVEFTAALMGVAFVVTLIVALVIGGGHP